jgi:hypothetical protein
MSCGVAMSELSNGTKKHTSKSYETIPLKAMIYQTMGPVNMIKWIYFDKPPSNKNA